MNIQASNNFTDEIVIWKCRIPLMLISQIEKDYLQSLPKELPDMNWVCGELDRIWYEQSLDNRKAYADQPIGAYYSHPVWMMNGIFSASDPASLSHRSAIANYLKSSKLNSLADYGGGFGQLALSMAKAMPDATIHVIEPYPSKVGIYRLQSEPKIQIDSQLSNDSYDAIVAQDVLEHVEDPIKLACEIAKSARVSGKIIFANCFFPVIQSHLPSTFYLRFTFNLVMRALGLRFVGTVRGAEHAQIFERIGDINLPRARNMAALAKMIGPFLNIGHIFLKFAHRILKNLLSAIN